MILGLLAGGVLRRGWPGWAKFVWLCVAGAVGLAPAGGWASWVSARWSNESGRRAGSSISGGLCFLFLAGFYAVLDVCGVRFWAFPLRVIGMNSIAAYCMAGLFEGFIGSSLNTHLGERLFEILGEPYEPLLHGAAVLLVLWLILFWMYRRKLFLRI